MRSDWKVVRTIRQNHARFQVGRKPVPFAGKHPIRIYWQFYTLTGANGPRYFGKPSRMTALRMRKLLLSGLYRDLVYAEYDKNSVILYFNGPVLRGGQAQFFDNTRIYHPWSMITQGWEWMLVPWWIKRIKTSKGIVQVYSSVEKLENITHLAPFKAYVSALRWEANG